MTRLEDITKHDTYAVANELECQWFKDRGLPIQRYPDHAVMAYIEALEQQRDEIARLREALRELRDVVTDQNRIGASWSPQIFSRLMTSLANTHAALKEGA